jgi:hypothetical protein
MEPWFAWAGRWRGVAFGGFLLLVGGTVALDNAIHDFANLGSVWTNLAMFAVIYVLFGILVVPLYGAVRDRLPAPWERLGVAFLPLHGLAFLLAVVMIPVVAFGGGGEVSGVPLTPLIAVYVTAGAFVVGHALERGRTFERLSDLRGDAKRLSVGVAFVVAPVAVGLFLLVGSLGEVFRAAY